MDSLRVVLVLLVRLQTPGCEGHIAKRIKIVGQPRTPFWLAHTKFDKTPSNPKGPGMIPFWLSAGLLKANIWQAQSKWNIEDCALSHDALALVIKISTLILMINDEDDANDRW